MFGKKRNTFAILTGVSMAALGAATPAIAQAQEQARVSDEIIVTAQKRAQDIQDVPIAVTALSGDQLQRAGIQDIRALQTLSASFNLNSSQTESGGTTIRIRGVGTTGNNAGLESSVGVFVDGVYLSRPAIALGELLDVQQIEILRGPQGTLFGRNTSAGALTVTTKAPSLDTFGAFGNMTVGEIDGGDFGSLASAQAGVNIPVVTDKLAFRISGATRVRDGLLTSTSNGIEQNSRDRWQVRGQALWAPTDNITVRVIVDHGEGRDNCCDAVVLQTASIAAFYAASGLPANGGILASGFSALESRTSNSNGQFQDPGEQTGISAQVDWHLGWGDLTYIAASRSAEARGGRQDDFTGLNTYSVGKGATVDTGAGTEGFGTNDYVSHEVRLAGENGPLSWMVGGYYGKEDIVADGTLQMGPDEQKLINAALLGGLAAAGVPFALINPNPALISLTLSGGLSSNGAFAHNQFTQNGESFSVFTHDTLALSDKLNVTVGLRYVDETKDGKFAQIAASNPGCAGAIATTKALAIGASPLLALALGNRGGICFPFAAVADLPGSGTGSNVPATLDPGTPVTFNKTFKDNTLVYTGNVTYAVTPDVNVYGSFTHGFKSGGFNLDPTAAARGADPRFKSEQTDSYELGVKSEWFDGRVRANLAAFYSDIQDFQVLEFTGIQFQTFNVDKVISSGAEMELGAKVFDGLGATLAVTYADARYPSDCVPTTASLTVRSLCGSNLTNAPLWVSIFGLNYDHPVGANYRLFGDASVRYETDRRTSTQAYVVASSAATLRTQRAAFDIQDANTKVNLRGGFGSQDERWAVEIWGTNVFNEQTRNVTFNLPLQGTGRGAFLEDPAMYGVTIRANY